MPTKKKDKNRTGTGLFSLEENAMVSPAAFEMGYEAREASSPFPRTPGARRKRTPEPDPVALDEADQHLILTYLASHRLLEQALVRAGFVMALSSHKQPRPDWCRWARHIEKQFYPLSSEELGMSVLISSTCGAKWIRFPGGCRTACSGKAPAPSVTTSGWQKCSSRPASGLHTATTLRRLRAVIRPR